MSSTARDQLSRSYFSRATLDVARNLLGMELIHIDEGIEVGGPIIETEAYIGEADDACHARAGRTSRTEIMYGQAGFSYVYFSYGMHWLFNIVTEEAGFPAAVLIRGIIPVHGQKLIESRRKNRPEKEWTNGPGKLCQALQITGEQNGMDICDPGSPLFIRRGKPITDSSVTTTPRVGLNKVSEPWKSIHWRFIAKKVDISGGNNEIIGR